MNPRFLTIRIPQALLLLALVTGQAVSAEDTAAVDVPARGMTMTVVEQSFGKPVEILPAVGEPPITRWVYPICTVYFERQHVIHSVVPRPPKS
jgi:hypothetical protein